MIKTMKHNFFKIALVAAVVATAGYGVYENQRQDMMSEVMMENLEALARYELPEVEVVCDKKPGKCWARKGALCMKGEYTGPACILTDNTNNFCNVCW